MAKDDDAIWHPDRRRGGDVVALLLRHDLAADDAGIADPAADAKNENDVPEAGSEDRQDRDREQNEWERELDIGQTHHDGVEPAAVVPGQQPQRAADGATNRDRGESDQKRHARAVNEPSQNVSPQVVG